ncbi:MAG: hypothetical protein ACOCZ8_03075 [Bacteroidota bacterium]
MKNQDYQPENPRPAVKEKLNNPTDTLLNALLEVEACGTCVTMVIPMQTVHPLSDQNPISLKEARKSLEEQLAIAGLEREGINAYLEHFDQLTEDFDRKHQEAALVIFIAENLQRAIKLPIESRFYISINDHFAIKHVLRAANRFPHALLLNLNKDVVDVFEMTRDTLRPIKTDLLPAEYKPFISAFMENTQESKDVIDDRAEAEWLNHIRHSLHEVVMQVQLPLIVAGTDRIRLGFVKGWDRPGTPIIAQVPGSFKRDEMRHQLHEKAIKAYDDLVDAQQQQHTIEAREIAGGRDAAEAISTLWPLAQLGQVNTLYVEKDYKTNGWVNIDGNEVKMNDEDLRAHEDYNHHDDIVAELIESVVRHGGKVHFLPQQSLADYGHAVAHLRYSR